MQSCSVLGCSLPPALLCGRCKKTAYCTANHLQEDWTTHKSVCAALSSDEPKVTDARLYEAFGTRPTISAKYGHVFRDELVGPLPEVSDVHFMEWQLPFGVKALVSANSDGIELTHEERLDIINTKGHKALIGTLKQVDRVRIAYQTFLPAQVAPDQRNRLMLWGLLHGVPSAMHAKREVATDLARHGHAVVVWDMLGLGQSSKVLGYFDANGKNITTEQSRFRADVDYVKKLINTVQRDVLRKTADERWAFQADDWGAAILFAYAEKYPQQLMMAAAFNPVALDGWEVAEIRAMGRTGAAWINQNLELGNFVAGVQTFDQTVLGIEKYMVQNHERMNRYGEREWLGPYVDVDMQNGKYSGQRSVDWVAVLSLMVRSTVLGPPDLLPYHATQNPTGTSYTAMTSSKYGAVPWLFGWGTADQMMPAVQRHRLARIVKAATGARAVVVGIDGADHFVESDRPKAVVSAILDAEQTLIEGSLPVRCFLGNEGTPKGDEARAMKAMDEMLGNGDLFAS